MVEVLRDYVGQEIPVHLVYVAPSVVPLKLRAFIDFAAPRLRADLSAVP